MVAFSLQHKAALEAVIPHIPLRLAEILQTNDALMQAFGHMAKIEMEEKGLGEVGKSADFEWPVIKIQSRIATFHRGGGA